GADEVLIVGHSSGAHLAVQVAAEVQRRAKGGAPLSILTIGQVIPMVSFLPTARDLRRDLHELSKDPEIYWLDVTALGDGACFALSDPVSVSGVAPPDEEKLWPITISAAFKRHLSEEQIVAYKWRFFRKHIQYLCAFGRPGDYDYFRITAGPKTLRERFGWRSSSASTNWGVYSPFRDF
ncbi:MAG: hypothetical protein AAFW69_00420, partial [Pseudomonadota bacterium]